MKRLLCILFLILLFVGVTSVSEHKFYAAIYQIDFVPQKKRVQITTRIFIDDLNEALKKSYHKTSYVGTERETPEDVALMKKYLQEKFVLLVNGQSKVMNFHSSETESNVLICYFSIKDVLKINTLAVENSILTEVYPDQQNIVQFNNNGKKQNLLLTAEKTKGMLK